MDSSDKSLNSKPTDAQKHKSALETTIINEIQLTLAEKRTSLASLRTGIALFALPMSVISFLIVTSKYYNMSHIMMMFIPLMAINATLVILGLYLLTTSIRHIRQHDQRIKELKRRRSLMTDNID